MSFLGSKDDRVLCVFEICSRVQTDLRRSFGGKADQRHSMVFNVKSTQFCRIKGCGGAGCPHQ